MSIVPAVNSLLEPSAPLSRTFFITGLGRSGTKFLSSILDRSREHRVVHECRIPGTRLRDGRMQHFPLYRFVLARHPFPDRRPGYGEVNSHLRRTLGPEGAGYERYVARRAIVFRRPEDVLASAMNRVYRDPVDFPRVCRRILRDYAHLLDLYRRGDVEYAAFSFERMTSEVEYLRGIAEWAGIHDIDVTEADLERKINVNATRSFPRIEHWDARMREVFDRIRSEEMAGRAPHDG